MNVWEIKLTTQQEVKFERSYLNFAGMVLRELYSSFWDKADITETGKNYKSLLPFVLWKYNYIVVMLTE